MKQSINLEEALVLAQGPKQQDWEEIADQTYSAIVKHPRYKSIGIQVRQLGSSGTAYSLQTTYLGTELNNWITSTDLNNQGFIGNKFKMIYDDAHRMFKRRVHVAKNS